SQYPQEDVYYRLRRFRTNAFHLTPHGENIAISGDLDTGVIPQMGVWYRFRVRVVDEVSQTRIQARVWIDCSSEPSAWQADAIDTHPLRPRSGTIGVWSFLAGDRAWDDLALRPIDPQDTCAGICGCDVVEQDLDGDCTVDCLDGCLDADGDGYGEPGGLADHCLAADCDDTDPAVHPGAPELTCDGIDNDCDAGTPDNLDTDADGFGCGADCDDADPDVNPGAPELTCDGRDNDCNPATPDAVDADVDGQDCSLDCDDQNPAVQAAPGEARELLIGPQKTLLTWSAPTTAGGDEAGLVYDLLRSTGPTG
ncbi:MAG: hypothetical protein GWN79_03220, partial [Actinobacteria bacterium]|nr:hypothetical protein [Actinomycetota bacterium]NIS29459.1 hypothetical protein [Actinomycetota bacterium]NIT97607.1 hypothetical protein [Actinomycetota bacterium]NIU18155.1 hypothetical protein [Actinomycetota bacterium]NIV54645.1 hypothetical protein [Actinomycetota bacterium]